MKRIIIKIFSLCLVIVYLQGFGWFAIAQCENEVKPNGSECSFVGCECASDVCYNGICVECAKDSDCEVGQTCNENKCS